jgi:hypothetical protein
VAASEEQRVEADQAKSFNILGPTVRAKMSAPTAEALIIDRLIRVPRFADVVIAGNGPKSRSELPHKFGRMLQVVLNLDPVNRNIAGVNDEIGMLLDDPRRERRPIRREMSLAAA